MKLAHCPKCGHNTLDFNALVIFCLNCGFQVVDPAPLPKDRDERQRMIRRGKRK